MKLHLFEHLHAPRFPLSERYENLVYGIVLIAGVPVIVIGLNYLTSAIFGLFK